MTRIIVSFCITEKCSCRKLSTKCALALSTMFLDMNEISDIEAEEKKPFWKFNPKYCKLYNNSNISFFCKVFDIIIIKKKKISCFSFVILHNRFDDKPSFDSVIRRKFIQNV